jgi:hypothetical protein
MEWPWMWSYGVRERLAEFQAHAEKYGDDAPILRNGEIRPVSDWIGAAVGVLLTEQQDEPKWPHPLAPKLQGE